MSRFLKNNKESDLRQEIENTFLGLGPETSKEYSFLLRKFRKNNKGKRIRCVCNKNDNPDPTCSSCLGEGWYWDEVVLKGFKSDKKDYIVNEKPGTYRTDQSSFIVRYSTDITELDRIIEFKYKEGEIKYPLERGQSWKIKDIIERRSDFGRIEFYVIECTKLDIEDTI